MTRDDLFKINAGIVKNLVEACGAPLPEGPPEHHLQPGQLDRADRRGGRSRRWASTTRSACLGVTTLDVVRAKTFYADKAGVDVERVDVPVVGGHAGVTILPLFSQAVPIAEQRALGRRHRCADQEDAGRRHGGRAGQGWKGKSATLSYGVRRRAVRGCLSQGP